MFRDTACYRGLMCCRMLFSRACNVAGAFGCIPMRLWITKQS